MASNLGSFNQSMLGAFSQSALKARGGGVAVTYEILASSGLYGSIDPTGTIVVDSGNDQLFEMFADLGYRVLQVVVDSINQGDLTEYTFVNVRDDHTIHVTFEKIPVTQVLAQQHYTRQGKVRVLDSVWPPYAGTRATSSGPIAQIWKTGSNWAINRAFIQFWVGSAATIVNPVLKIPLQGIITSLMPSFTAQFYEISNFYPRDTSDFDLTGTLVASKTIYSGMNDTVELALPLASITPGAYWSLQIRHSGESGPAPGTSQSSQLVIGLANTYLVLNP